MSGPINVSLTKRERRRKLRSGGVAVNVRWVLNYRDPRTGEREQRFFERQKDAIARRNEIVSQVQARTYVPDADQITVGEAVKRWVADRRGEVKDRTLGGYEQTSRYIVGPLLIGTPDQRRAYTESGELPPGTHLKPLLGAVKANRLTTGEIRDWHKLLTREVGAYTANRARSYLASALALAAEDLNIRPPAMPSKLGRGRAKVKKAILTTEQVGKVIAACRNDPLKGVYVAFPFLTGTRPSEQLALTWEDVDFDRNVIRIQRMQEMDGRICDITKTAAGRRDIPMSATIRAMLIDWRERCPRKEDEPHRVFPGLGHRQPWPLPRVGGGGLLLYANFRVRMWKTILKRAGVPYVTPHSARHSFISTLQAEGVEVGLVAKIAGHANAVITLSHYTQAVRGGEAAIFTLDRAYAEAA